MFMSEFLCDIVFVTVWKHAILPFNIKINIALLILQLLEEDVALKRFKSYKNSVKQVSKIGNVLTLAVVVGMSS